MIKPLEFEGQWWLPDKPDNKIFGICKYNPKAGVELELKGSFFKLGDEDAKREISLIHGLEDCVKPITLLKCRHGRLQAFGAVVTTTSYRAIFLLSGALFSEEDDIRFNKSTVELYPLTEWLGISGIEVPLITESHQPFNISYNPPSDINLNINPKLKIVIRFYPQGLSYQYYQGDVNLEQGVAADFIFSRSTNLDDCLRNIGILTDFLKFATLSDSYPKKITFFSDDLVHKINDADFKEPIDVYFDNSFRFDKTGELYDHDMLFNRGDIEDTLEETFKNWYSKYDSLRQFFILYLSVINKPESYLESKFRSLISALEFYHQHKYQGAYLSNDDYKPIYSQLVEQIPKSLSKAHRDSLVNRLKYGNRYSLRSRLKDLFNKHAVALSMYFKDPEKLIGQIVDTRNYYVHYDEQDIRKALRAKDLLHLTKKLQIIVEIIILSEIGFEPPLIKRLFEKSWKYRHYIELFAK